MKKIILLAMVMMTLLISLAGCYWPYPDHGRGNRHDSGDRHDRGEGTTGTTGTEEVTRDVATQEEDTIFSCSKSQEENLIAVKTSVPVYKMILTFISKKYSIKLQINRK